MKVLVVVRGGLFRDERMSADHVQRGHDAVGSVRRRIVAPLQRMGHGVQVVYDVHVNAARYLRSYRNRVQRELNPSVLRVTVAPDGGSQMETMMAMLKRHRARMAACDCVVLLRAEMEWTGTPFTAPLRDDSVMCLYAQSFLTVMDALQCVPRALLDRFIEVAETHVGRNHLHIIHKDLPVHLATEGRFHESTNEYLNPYFTFCDRARGEVFMTPEVAERWWSQQKLPELIRIGCIALPDGMAAPPPEPTTIAEVLGIEKCG